MLLFPFGFVLFPAPGMLAHDLEQLALLLFQEFLTLSAALIYWYTLGMPGLCLF